MSLAQVHRGTWMALTALGVVVAAGLGLRVLALAFESRLTFFPSAHYAMTPSELGLPYEEVALRTADGVEVHAWFLPAGGRPGRGAAAGLASGPPPRRPLTLLFFHGNAENLGTCVTLAALTRPAGLNLMLVDYRGYGRSRGRPSEKGINLDGEAALSHLRGRADVDPGRIVVWGRSIGGAVAVHLAAHAGPLHGVVLESPFTSARDLLREGGYWPLYVLSLFGSYRFDLAEAIGGVAAPVLVIHGTDDEVIPFRLGQRLHDAAPGRRMFHAVAGGGHNDLWADHGGEMWRVIRRFLATLD